MSSTTRRYLVQAEDQPRPVKVGERDLTQTVLSTIFHLVPSSITLVSERDSNVETANANGEFSYWHMSQNESSMCGTAKEYRSTPAKQKSRSESTLRVLLRVRPFLHLPAGPSRPKRQSGHDPRQILLLRFVGLRAGQVEA